MVGCWLLIVDVVVVVDDDDDDDDGDFDLDSNGDGGGMVVVAEVQVFSTLYSDVDISHHQCTLLWEGIQCLQFHTVHP